MPRGVFVTAMSVRGVPRRRSALRLSSTFLAIRSAAVVTGATVSPVAVTWQPTTARRGLTVGHVCISSCVAGVLLLTIPPSALASMETSPVGTSASSHRLHL